MDIQHLFCLSPTIREREGGQPFWYEREIVQTDKKTGEKFVVDNKIEISYSKLFDFLQSQNIGRYELNEEIIFVWLDKHIIKTVKTQKIRDFCLNFVFKTAQENEVIEKFLKGAGIYFGDQNLQSMAYINLPKKNFSPNEINLFFQNGFVKIGANSCGFLESDKATSFVWEHEIIKHSIHLEELPIKIEEVGGSPFINTDLLNKDNAGHFFEYLYQTSNFFHTKKKEDLDSLEKIKISNAILNKMSAIGYLLQPHKDPITTKAIICMDYKISEVGESNGGTGKSIFGKAIEKFLPSKYINAKNPKVWEDSFVFQGTDQRTRLLFIDDANQNIDFGMFYNIITGTFNVNIKNKAPLDLKFDESPKLLITTNHAIKGSGDSDLRRQFLLAFSDFFSIENTPIKHLGQRLFDDWDVKEWNKFYNLMILCCQVYLKYGLIEGQNENLELRKIRQEIGEQFISWAEIYFADEMNLDMEFPRAEAYKDFENAFPTYVKKYCDARHFKKKIIRYAEFRAWRFSERKSCGKEVFKYITK